MSSHAVDDDITGSDLTDAYHQHTFTDVHGTNRDGDERNRLQAELESYLTSLKSRIDIPSNFDSLVDSMARVCIYLYHCELVA